MKAGWEIKKLGEVCEILDSLRKPVTKKDRREGCYPYYGASGIQDYVDSYIFDGRYLLVGEDGAKWGTNDRSAFIIEGKCWVNNHAHILKVYDNVVDTFLEYYLVFSDLDKYITGAIVPKLTQQALRNIPIPIPPLPEQERIVSELDLISGIIEKKKQQLKELDSLAQSIFYEMFGSVDDNFNNFKIAPLSEVFSVIKDGTHQTPQYVDEKNGVKFLSAKDVVSGVIDWSNIKYIQFDLHEELHKRVAPKRNDILLCKNGTYGICSLVETDEIFDIYVSLALLRPNVGYIPKYLVYAINNPITKFQFDKSIKGIGVPNLHLGEIKKTMIIIPPFLLQQQFAEKIEVIERQKELIKQSLKDTETLFNSRMDFYFN